ncbi:MAG: hypothetical protein KGI69_00280 [Patescibacteria group bacterium]|nr:hypothetical protein [Patescibacteria group bacterium]
MSAIDPSDVYLAIFAASAVGLIAYLHAQRFVKVGHYDFMEVLRPEWEDIGTIKQDMEVHIRGRLKAADVESSLEKLEYEGLAVSRSVPSEALFLPLSNRWIRLPRKQFRRSDGGTLMGGPGPIAMTALTRR